ncbi:hypothetical protein CspeluHIS016_0500150 [Cutaneotrichosporon spelunceum]|uniref:Acid protease n=1 Tax=Cutaneotrichosporon spelunceum TaxID=1672016 RepID=A0AAD3YDB0_9TREE|nr:hypothetical protein CspeluHIS016_0500150 [Cutaneotrichosporon spelunceum]
MRPTLALALLAPALAWPVTLPLVRLKRTSSHSQSLTPLETGFGVSLKLGNQDVSVYLTLAEGNGLTVFGSFSNDTCFFQPGLSPTFDRRGTLGCPFDLAFDELKFGGVCLTTAFAYADAHYAPRGLRAPDRLPLPRPGPLVGFTVSSSSSPCLPAGHLLRRDGGSASFGSDAERIDTQYNGYNNGARARLLVNAIPVNVPDVLGRQGRGLHLNSRNSSGSRSDVLTRPELASNVLQIVPPLAEAMFKLVPGAVAVEWSPASALSARSNSDSNRADASAAVEASTGVRPLEHGGSYAVPCDTNATITLEFGGVDYPLGPGQWVVPNAPSPREENKGAASLSSLSSRTGNGCEMCRTRVFVPMSGSPDAYADDTGPTPDIILGAPFLETVYTTLSYGEQPMLGFAKLCQ